MAKIDTPLQNHQCPLCTLPNHCTPASTGNFANACWCNNTLFPQALLATLPTKLRDTSCICQTCADKFNAALCENDTGSPILLTAKKNKRGS